MRQSARRVPGVIVLIVCSLGIAVVLSACAASSGKQAEASVSPRPNNVREEVHRLAQKLTSHAGSQVATSSNPYDYTAQNPAYDELVRLGTPALPAIVEELDASSQDGLREYLLAIAAESIAKVDLKAGSQFRWSTGKQWPRLWEKHLREIPPAVNEIANSDEPLGVKIKRLVALGTPAIPYILDAIASGNVSLSPAAVELAQGTAEAKEAGGLPSEIDPTWAKIHVSSFADLMELVQNAQ